MTTAPATGNSHLIRFIRDQIGTHGPVSFRWFMEQCLYHPKHGYYTAGLRPIGPQGDFYTNVSMSRIFGQLLAKQFEEMWKLLDCPGSFALLEQGAHDGRLAQDILTWTRDFSPEFHKCVKYWIVEPTPAYREAQAYTLKAWPDRKVRWLPDIRELDHGSLHGVFFSHELLDALPVHLVSVIGEQWQENFVDYSGGAFKFVYGPPSTSDLEDYLHKIPFPVGQDFRTEVNLRAQGWIRDVAKVMRQGFLFVVDYGFSREEYYQASRNEGTLTCYHEHQKSHDPLQRIGECDITAHVDFTGVAEAGEDAGLSLVGYTDQHHFLVGLGKEELETLEKEIEEEDLNPEVEEFLSSFRTLMHPGIMGMTHKMLVMNKNIEKECSLAGLQFARDGRALLGLGAPPSRVDSL